MKRKKLTILALSSVLAMTAFVALSACKGGDDPNGPNKPGPVTNVEYSVDGKVYNSPTAKDYTANVADTRTASYTAYQKNGTSLGDFKTIAEAINAAVAHDANENTFAEGKSPYKQISGAYVTRKGETRKIFQNRNGFAETSDDMFWYYEDDNKLDAMDCWNSSQTMAMMQNSNYSVHKVTNRGTTSMQSWNSYGLLDQSGQRYESTVKVPNEYELSSTMDAGLIQFPARLKGVTGLNYTIDLSSVKLTPAYAGADKTYAFLGFYSWQDYYVIATGIACDVNTGNWYAFEGTSRDNSFSDVEYGIGDCIMTSTWHEEGYFTPDNNAVKMSIVTKTVEDDEGEYQVNDMLVEVEEGATYARRIDQSVINNHFPGADIGYENSYIFIAGLDIKTDMLSDGTTPNVDYSNGAAFENMKIIEATAHVPDDDEMTESRYGFAIKPEWKGKDHNFLMASNAEKTEGIYDYSILTSNAFTTYTQENEHDVFTFSYKGKNVDDNALGTILNGYQSKIDALGSITKDTIRDNIQTVLDMAEWYGEDANGTKSTIAQPYRPLLDFAPYLHAQGVLEEALNLSDAAKKVMADFRELGNIYNYNYLGWTAPEDATTISGYLYSEIEKFKTIKTAKEALTTQEQTDIFYLISKETYDEWTKLATDVDTLLANEAFQNAKISSLDEKGNALSAPYTGLEAMQEIINWSTLIAKGTAWDTGVNDDGNTGHNPGMTSDNAWMPSIHVCFLVEKFDELNIKLPKFVDDLLLRAKYYEEDEEGTRELTAFVKDYKYLYNTLNLVKKIQDEKIVYLNADVAAVVNKYMIGTEKFLEGGLNWNYNNSNGADFTYRSKIYKKYFGLDTKVNLSEHLKTITNLVAEADYEVHSSGLGVVVAAGVTSIEATTPNGSDAAKASAEKFNALGTLTVEGYTATAESYLADIAKYQAAKTEFDALTKQERAYVRTQINVPNFKAWGTEAEAVAALEKIAAYASGTTQMYLAGAETTTEVTAKNALNYIVYWGSRIAKGDTFTVEENDGDVESSGVKIMNIKRNLRPSLTIVQSYEYLTSIEGAELPAYVKALLKTIEFEAFQKQIYHAIADTAQVAKAITDGSYTSAAQLKEAELEILNTYWVNGYKHNNQLAYNWTADGFNAGIENNAKYIMLVSGNAITGKTATETILVVSDFLEDRNYTLKDNKWGVTVDKVFGQDLSAAVIDAINTFSAVSDVKTYSYKGYEAPTGTAIAGYIYSEVAAYNSFATKYAALTEEEKAVIDECFPKEQVAAWKSISEAFAAFEKDANYSKVNSTAPAKNKGESDNVAFNGKQALAEIIGWSLRIATGAKGADVADDGNSAGVKVMNSDNTWNASFRISFFVQEIEAAGVTLPDYVKNLLKTIGYYNDDGTLTAFTTDTTYLYQVLNLVNYIKDKTAVDQHVADVVNTYMYNVDRFQEGGLQWNYHSGSGDKDFAYRDKIYKTYFGLEKTTDLCVYIKQITDFVGLTATTTGLGVTAKVEVK